MGPYLGKPKTKILFTDKENERFIYCTAEMQGWRSTQEDAHVALLNYDNHEGAFFAVFDGHGGDEVSKYCSLHLPNFIKNSSLYKENKISQALEECFLEFDSTLKQPNVLSELKKLAGNIDEDIDEDENPFILKKESAMPIESLIQNYKQYFSSVNGDENKENSKKKSEEENNEKNEDDHKSQENLEKKHCPSSSSSKVNNNLLGSETLNAFLQDYKEEDEEDEESENYVDESNESDENGELAESDEDEFIDDDDEDDESEQDYDDDDDDDDDHYSKPDAMKMGMSNFLEMNEPGKGSGCTAIVAIIRDNMLYVANVGDSRCILSREGNVIEMSEDHKPEDDKETARILKAGGEITPDGRINGGLNMSRSIGDHMYKNNENISNKEQMITALPDIRTCQLDLEKDDFLFLACDGIWNCMSNQEVVTFINSRLKENKDPNSICEELFKNCLAPNTEGDGSGCDNMTCILVLFKKDIDKQTVSLKRELNKDEQSSSNSESINKKIKMEENIDLFKPGPSRS